MAKLNKISTEENSSSYSDSEGNDLLLVEVGSSCDSADGRKEGETKLEDGDEVSDNREEEETEFEDGDPVSRTPNAWAFFSRHAGL